MCFLGSREVTRPIYGNLVGELKKNTSIALSRGKYEMVKLDDFIVLFFARGL